MRDIPDHNINNLPFPGRLYREAVEAAAEDERERLAKELAAEEKLRREEEEERLAVDTNSVPVVDEIRDFDDRSEDTYAHRNLSDHEREEYPEDPTVEDNTQVIRKIFNSTFTLLE